MERGIGFNVHGQNEKRVENIVCKAGRYRRRWEDNFEIDLIKIGLQCVDLINQGQDGNHSWLLWIR